MSSSRLFSLIIIMCFVFLIAGQYLTIKNQKRTIDELKSQIVMLEEKSKVQETQVQLAQRQAEDKMNEIETKSARIMEIEVPEECEKAINWAIQQAMAIA